MTQRRRKDYHLKSVLLQHQSSSSFICHKTVMN